MKQAAFATMDAFEVPEEFTYLCTATHFNDLNLIPLYQLNALAGRVRRLVIHVGVVPDQAQARNLANQHAASPARWLATYARTTLGLDDRAIHVHEGDPDDLHAWSGGVQWADRQGFPILANLQGGTTQTSLGIHMALASCSQPVLPLFVGKSPALTSATATIGNNPRMIWLPVTRESQWMPLDLLFSLRRIERRTLQEQEVHIADWSARHAPVALNLLEALETRMPGIDELIGWLARTLGAEFNDEIDLQAARGADRHGPRAEALFSNAIWQDGVVSGVGQHGFLTGRWLEIAVAERLRATRREQPWLTYHTSVPFGPANGTTTDPANEIDILIQHGNVLHPVELTTAGTASLIRARMDKLSANKTALGGAQSRAWLLAPRIPDQLIAETGKRARTKGVTLLTGWGCVQELMRAVAQLHDYGAGTP